MVRCKICGENFKVITNTHLSKHNLTVEQYRKKFGSDKVGFGFNVTKLPKNDPRYKKWRKSLFKRPPSWNKGYTKNEHPGVAKISETFRKRKIDNFATWRDEARSKGKIPKCYSEFKHSKELAFLIGMVLGDGNIYEHERTESLRITLGTDKPELWQYTAKIVKKIFKKEPYVYKSKTGEFMVISLYQKKIGQRLGVPTGKKTSVRLRLPDWIKAEDEFLKACLRGLYEAEGSFNIHEPTYTYKLIFTNRNDSLLNEVFKALKKLEFHPHQSKYKVQVSKKEEVFRLKEILSFRKYNCRVV